MLCCMTAAWAEGTGDGTQNNPYAGEWQASDLASVLKVGDFLSYHCTIKNGNIFVTDTKLNKTICNGVKDFAFGDPIDNSPWNQYGYYCSYNNDLCEYSKFQVTNLEFTSGNSGIIIKGYYSGLYREPQSADTVYVSSYQELLGYASKFQDINIRLTDNISLESTEGNIALRTSSAFKGSITGSYYAINPQTGKMEETNYAIYGAPDVNTRLKAQNPLFHELNGAKIDHVTFMNMSLNKEDEDNWGILCRTANNTTFRNVAIQRVEVRGNHDNVGTIAGTANHCTFENVYVSNCEVRANGICAGGLVGKATNNCDFQTCMTDLLTGVFCDGRFTSSGAYAGGITGWAENDTFNHCVNAATVAAKEDAVGGIVGKSIGSNFSSCSNSGTVAHCKESDYEDIYSRARTKAQGLTMSDLSSNSGGAIAAGTATGLIAGAATGGGILVGGATAITTYMVAGFILTTIAASAVIVAAVVAVVAVTAAVIYGFTQLIEDDELGGICGRAEGGFFDKCWNTAHLMCRDVYGGGIVGIGKGVTINNCMNSGIGEFKQESCGSIIGYATSLNGTKTKVNNCFTAIDYPIIGEADAVDPKSFNNYRHRDANTKDRRATISYEVETSMEQERSGIVARWLNNGMENRAIEVKPWHQDVFTATAPGKPWDLYPVLDPTHMEVKPERVALDCEIRTPEELMKFAERVNNATQENGDQFLRAALMNDIDMSELAEFTWTPIGVDESYRQFRGFFDGRGHTIKNLKCVRSSSAGLFGVLHANAEILNVIVGYDSELTPATPSRADSQISTTTDDGAGGIAGTVKTSGWNWGNVIIENCGSYATVEATKHAGGILGRIIAEGNVRVYINNCFNMGNIKVSQGNSGTICGYTQNYAVVTNSWSINKLSSTNESKPYDDTRTEPEFFAGYDTNIDIRNCYNIALPHYLSGDLAQKGVTNINIQQSGDGILGSGKLTYLLNGETNESIYGNVWQQELGVDPFPVFGNKGVYHTREVSNEYGTVCLPYVLVSDDNIHYYTFSEATDDAGETVLNFQSTQVLDAGTPALFHVRDTSKPAAFYGGGDAWADNPEEPRRPANWNLLGTFQEKIFNGDDADPIYYISAGAIKHGQKVTIAPYRAYFQGPNYSELTSPGNGGTNNAKAIRIVLDEEDDEASAIRLVYDSESDTFRCDVDSAFANKTFNLQGVEVGDDYRGIVIRNGKKVLRK